MSTQSDYINTHARTYILKFLKKIRSLEKKPKTKRAQRKVNDNLVQKPRLGQKRNEGNKSHCFVEPTDMFVCMYSDCNFWSSSKRA